MMSVAIEETIIDVTRAAVHGSDLVCTMLTLLTEVERFL